MAENKNKSQNGAEKRNQGRPRKNVETTAVKTRQKQVPVKKPHTKLDNLPEGMNTKIVHFLMNISKISEHADRRNAQTLLECLGLYMQLCAEYDFKVTNETLYMACNIDAQDIYNWSSGKVQASRDPQFKEFAKTVKEICSGYRSVIMSENKINPVVGIWWQKVHDGYRDTGNPGDIAKTIENETTAQEIINKYKSLPD